MISQIKAWTKEWNTRFYDTEVRIYVDMEDGRRGCYYLTGNPYQPPGTYEGKIKPEEWQQAEELAVWDGKWHTLYKGEIAKLMETSIIDEVEQWLNSKDT